MRLRDTLAALATIALGAVILEGCATTHGGGMGYGEAPGARGGRICHAFDARDFYLGQSGVSAGGDLLIYTQPSVDCGQRPAWVARRAPLP